MPKRLPDHERGAALQILHEGSAVRAFSTESVAAALYMAGEDILSRSLKYHRPRGAFCLDGHCSGCLMRVDGIPNVRSCMVDCRNGSAIGAQNAFPSAETDLLGAVDFLFASGMNHHTLMTGSRAMNQVTQKVVRHLSGLGELPDRAASPAKPSRLEEVDVLVVGGGPAGLRAATEAARAGARTLLVDEGRHIGGCLRTDPRYGIAQAEALLAEARAAGAECRARTTALAFVEDEGGITAIVDEERLTRVRARATIHATGSYAQNELFENNDRPGVMALRAVGRLLVEDGICPDEAALMVGDSEAAAALAEALAAHGCQVERIDPASERLVSARGGKRVKAAVVEGAEGRRTIPCRLIIVATAGAPASELARQQGAEVVLRADAGGFAVVVDGQGRASGIGVFACGDVCGYRGPSKALAEGERVGRHAAHYALQTREAGEPT